MNNQEQTIAIFRVLQFISDGGNMFKKIKISVFSTDIFYLISLSLN